MFEKWLESDEFPGTRVLVRPFDGAEVLAVQMMGREDVLARTKAIYSLAKSVTLNWEHMPLIGDGNFSEKYEPALWHRVRPDAALWVFVEVSRHMSSLSEEERGN